MGDPDLKALREKAVARDADGYVNMIVGTEVILAMIERIERLKWIVKQYKFYGTDGCRGCETGRVTLFIANESCISCDPAPYRNPFDKEASDV